MKLFLISLFIIKLVTSDDSDEIQTVSIDADGNIGISEPEEYREVPGPPPVCVIIIYIIIILHEIYFDIIYSNNIG